MKVKIKFPVLCVDLKEVELSESEVETLQNCTQSEKAKIIEKYLSHDEMGHIPGTIEGALEYGYAAIIFE
jgi:hypothetical protein